MSMEYPKLRPIEALPYDEPGQDRVILRDPSNLTETAIVVPYNALEILGLFDGNRSIPDIQSAYEKRYATILTREQIEGLIKTLDKNLLLDSETFRRFLKDVEEEFRRSDLRKATLAGKGYEDDPVKLGRQLDAYFTSDGGPGGASAFASKPEDGKGSKTGIKGAVLPHIDLGRGGTCYAWGYKEIEESANAKCFILLGTFHGAAKRLFNLTKKDFETPFGRLRTDGEMVNALERDGGKGLFQDEFVHRNEHSIEFQALFLKYLYKEADDVTIVPVLCSSFYEIMSGDASPSSVQEVNDFFEALRGAIERCGRDVFFLASADLSHVGPRFGDPEPLTEQQLHEIGEEDIKMIRFIEDMDAEGFFSNVQKDGDKRKICGLSPIYVLLKLIDASRGRLLQYKQWPDPMGMVSFASISFH